MFKEQKVMTLDILSKKAKCSGKTILRRLKEHGYHTTQFTEDIIQENSEKKGIKYALHKKK